MTELNWTRTYDSADGSPIQILLIDGHKLVVYADGSGWFYAIHSPNGQVESADASNEDDAKRICIAIVAAHHPPYVAAPLNPQAT